MSKIGKQPIQINTPVELAINGSNITVKGPRGVLEYTVPSSVSVSFNEGSLVVTPTKTTPQSSAMWGLWRSLLANAVAGVTDGFTKELELVGVGYRVQTKGAGIELDLGYSHKIDYVPVEGVKIEVEKGVIRVSGVDKQKVGQAAAEIRSLRKPEPYKGKGVRYVGEVVRIKPGKSAKAGAA